MKKFLFFIAGGLAGFVNGLLGAGGGMIAVPALKYCGLKNKEAHATSIAIISPISAISAYLYYNKGVFTLSDVLPFIPFGLVGAIVGGLLLSKFSPKTISRIFGVLLIYSGVKMIIG